MKYRWLRHSPFTAHCSLITNHYSLSATCYVLFIYFTFKRDLVYPYEKGDSRLLVTVFYLMPNLCFCHITLAILRYLVSSSSRKYEFYAIFFELLFYNSIFFNPSRFYDGFYSRADHMIYNLDVFYRSIKGT